MTRLNKSEQGWKILWTYRGTRTTRYFRTRRAALLYLESLKRAGK